MFACAALFVLKAAFQPCFKTREPNLCQACARKPLVKPTKFMAAASASQIVSIKIQCLFMKHSLYSITLGRKDYGSKTCQGFTEARNVVVLA